MNIMDKINAYFNKQRVQQQSQTNPVAVDRTTTPPMITPPRENPQPSTQQQLHSYSFRVAGVTANNDLGKDIQGLLKRNGRAYCKENYIPFYSDYTNREILDDNMDGVSEFEELTFENSKLSFVPEPTNPHDINAIKVFITYTDKPIHIGYVPKKETKNLKNILDHKEISFITASFVGGKIKVIEYDYETDKDKVITKELTLGVEITIKYKET